MLNIDTVKGIIRDVENARPAKNDTRKSVDKKIDIIVAKLKDVVAYMESIGYVSTDLAKVFETNSKLTTRIVELEQELKNCEVIVQRSAKFIANSELRAGRPRADLNIDLLKELYRMGFGYGIIARLTGYKNPTVVKYMQDMARNNELETPEIKRARGKLSDSDIVYLRRLGIKVRNLSDVSGLTDDKIYSILKKNRVDAY